MSPAQPVIVPRLMLDARPAWHLPRPWEQREKVEHPDGLTEVTMRTVCGVVFQRFSWRPGLRDDTHVEAHRLRRDHAELIARPCRRCMPDG